MKACGYLMSSLIQHLKPKTVFESIKSHLLNLIYALLFLLYLFRLAQICRIIWVNLFYLLSMNEDKSKDGGLVNRRLFPFPDACAPNTYAYYNYAPNLNIFFQFFYNFSLVRRKIWKLINFKKLRNHQKTISLVFIWVNYYVYMYCGSFLIISYINHSTNKALNTKMWISKFLKKGKFYWKKSMKIKHPT